MPKYSNKYKVICRTAMPVTLICVCGPFYVQHVHVFENNRTRNEGSDCRQQKL